MKKAYVLTLMMLAAALACGIPAAGQSLCFWTDHADVTPVRIYIDQEYLGDVTAAFKSQPLLDTEGTLSVDTTPRRHDITAVDKYGRVYKGWSGHVNPKAGETVYLRIRGGQFRSVDRDDADYAFIFLDWNPLFDLPYYYGYGRVFEDLDPLEDNGLLIGMAATAIGATAALGMAAAKNWDKPDGRFPYFALGLGTEYFSTLRSWRNVARLKWRMGGKG